ncbi:MAG: SemiSWEET family sugar transporter [Candidatus Aenigmatarchaeota archaeon]
MSSIAVDMIGYTAGVLTLLNMFPQVIKSIKRKSAEDVSYLMVLTYALSMVCWVVYAAFIDSWPIIITNSIAFGASCLQLILMVKYKRRT